MPEEPLFTYTINDVFHVLWILAGVVFALFMLWRKAVEHQKNYEANLRQIEQTRRLNDAEKMARENNTEHAGIKKEIKEIKEDQNELKQHTIKRPIFDEALKALRSEMHDNASDIKRDITIITQNMLRRLDVVLLVLVISAVMTALFLFLKN